MTHQVAFPTGGYLHLSEAVAAAAHDPAAAPLSLMIHYPTLVPGVLQHRDYAHHVLREATELSPVPLDQRAEVRASFIANAAAALDGDRLRVAAVITPASLEQFPPDIKAAQVRHLLDCIARWPQPLDLRCIAPGSGVYPGIEVNWTLCEQRGQTALVLGEPDTRSVTLREGVFAGSDDAEVIRRFGGVFTRMQKKALSPSGTVAYLHSLLEEPPA